MEGEEGEMVNKDRLKLGLEALRSGEYIQGQRALAPIVTTSDGREEQRFCCLGVLCEVAIKNGLDTVESVEAILQKGYRNVEDEGSDESVTYSILPQEVRDWYGFSTSVPAVNVIEQRGVSSYEVTHLNDISGWSFDQIANGFAKTYLEEES